MLHPTKGDPMLTRAQVSPMTYGPLTAPTDPPPASPIEQAMGSLDSLLHILDAEVAMLMARLGSVSRLVPMVPKDAAQPILPTGECAHESQLRAYGERLSLSLTTLQQLRSALCL